MIKDGEYFGVFDSEDGIKHSDNSMFLSLENTLIKSDNAALLQAIAQTTPPPLPPSNQAGGQNNDS